MSPTKTFWVLLLGGLAQVALVASVPYPPVQDYPNHLLRIHANNQLDEVPVYSRYLTRDRAFRPNSLGDWIVGGLANVMPIRLAGKIGLCLAIGLAAVATWYYLETFGGGVLAALIALHVLGGWLFHKGFLNNHVAVSLGLIYLASLWPRDGVLTWRRWLVSFGISLAMAAAHAFVFGTVVLIAGFAAVLQPEESWRRRSWRVSPPIPGILVGLIYAIQQAGSGLLANRPVYEFHLKELLLWQPLSIFGRYQLAWDRWVALFSLALLGLALLICLSRVMTGALSSRPWVVMLFVLCGAGLYLLAPSSLTGGWVHGGQRAAHLLTLLALPLLGAVPLAMKRVSTAVLVLAFVVTMVLTAREYREFQIGALEYVALGDSLPEGRLILPLNLESPLDDLIRPNLHLWSYLCIERDCLSPFLFANPYANSLYFKRIPEWPPEGEMAPRNWESIVGVLGRESYEGVLLHGRAPEGEAVLRDVVAPVSANGAGVLLLRDLDSAR